LALKFIEKADIPIRLGMRKINCLHVNYNSKLFRVQRSLELY